MRFLDIFKPTDATIEFGQRIINLTYRVVIITGVIFVFGALAVGFGQAVSWGAHVGGANDTAKQFVQNGSNVLFVLIVLISWVLAFVDLIKVALMNFFNWSP